MELVFSFVLVFTAGVSSSLHNEGYIAYCPCMGRFGNQADHFLGALAFSKGINRTLILPPWVEYRYGEPRSYQIPFNKYFREDHIAVYHSVITMESFMSDVAPSIWPPSKRISFCYTKRIGEEENSCNAKAGNPFGPFWDTFNVNFVASEFYGPLNYDAHNTAMMDKWKQKYTPDEWPVLAFTGAPASFPVQNGNQHLQKYLTWTDEIASNAKQFIKTHMNKGAFLGIHLRNGQDWMNACQHVKDSLMLFAAPQCVGYKNERGPLTISMCFPKKDEIMQQLKKTIKKIENVKYIYVASDHDHMLEDLKKGLINNNIEIIVNVPSDPHLDLAILGQANYFIGNCVSSYTAFVKRERDVKGLPSGFWAFPARRKKKNDEL